MKWPNDIYYKSDMKLGGILVQSSVMGKMAYINVGELVVTSLTYSLCTELCGVVWCVVCCMVWCGVVWYVVWCVVCMAVVRMLLLLLLSSLTFDM